MVAIDAREYHLFRKILTNPCLIVYKSVLIFINIPTLLFVADDHAFFHGDHSFLHGIDDFAVMGYHDYRGAAFIDLL